jgi:hypothetical protein
MRKHKKRGSSLMREKGYMQIVLWLDHEEQRDVAHFVGLKFVPLATLARRALMDVVRGGATVTRRGYHNR